MRIKLMNKHNNKHYYYIQYIVDFLMKLNNLCIKNIDYEMDDYDK
jgi:hypothetical protein